MRTYKSIVVTGGCGFIGFNFVQYLVDNNLCNNIIVIDNMSIGSIDTKKYFNIHKIKHYEYDITADFLISKVFNENIIDCVVHFAAESHVDRSITNPIGFAKTNVIGTLNILEQIRLNDSIHLHHISTDEVFGALLPDEPSFIESTAYNPHSPYSASKAASDHFVRAYGDTYGISYTISNCSNNYGPWQNEEKLIPKVISNALNNLNIPVYGTGTNIRNWLYVMDHCSAIYKIMTESDIHKTYVVGSKDELTNIDLIKIILNKLNKPESLIKFVEDRAGHDFRYSIDSSKLESELKWKPMINFETGIEKTINFYLNKGKT